MNMRSSWIWGSLLVALMVGVLAVPEADARGSRGGGSGGHSGGRSMRAPRVSSNMRAFKAPTYKAPRMPHAAAPARSNTGRTNTARSNTGRTNTSQARANNTQTRASRAATTGTTNSATTGNTGATRTASTSTNTSPNSYTYGSGTGTRRYNANSYGQGYRNRYNGGRSGYGRSQGNNRAIVSRLRSVHSNLARIDHDYRGHRVRAMHAVSMAIRQLSHRSMVSSNQGFAAGGNNAMAMGMRRGGGVGGGVGNAGGRRNQPMNQNQSDSRMSHALRTLQGINMQMSSQGSTTNAGHGRARGHVQRAIHELNTALSIR